MSPSSSQSSLSGAEQDSKDSTPRLSRRVVVTPWEPEQEAMLKPPKPLFTPETQAIIYGMQPRACQGMLDFDHCCSRKTPSVAAMVYPFRYLCVNQYDHFIG